MVMTGGWFMALFYPHYWQHHFLGVKWLSLIYVYKYINININIYIRTTDIIKYSFSVGKTPFCWCWNVIMFYPHDCAKGEFHRHRHVTLPLSEDIGQRDQETHDLRENAGIDLGNSRR